MYIYIYIYTRGFIYVGFPIENPIKIDDLEVPPFQETSISIVFMGVVKTNFGQVG